MKFLLGAAILFSTIQGILALPATATVKGGGSAPIDKALPATATVKGGSAPIDKALPTTATTKGGGSAPIDKSDHPKGRRFAKTCTGTQLGGTCVEWYTVTLPTGCINTASKGQENNISSLHVETATVFFTGPGCTGDSFVVSARNPRRNNLIPHFDNKISSLRAL